MMVVFAIEPRSYRQVMGQAIQALRPHVEVVVLDPETLETAVARLDPDVIFANRPEGGGGAGPGRLGKVPPLRGAAGQGGLAKRSWELEEVDLPDLLSIVDRAEELARAGRDPRGH